MSGEVNGSQDKFTNEAVCTYAVGGCGPDSIPSVTPILADEWALAQYMPDASLSGSSDNIMADFYPNPGSAPAARGCLTVQAKSGLFLESELVTAYNAPNENFVPNPTTISPPQKITSTYSIMYPGPLAGTASLKVTPNGTTYQLHGDFIGRW